MTFRRGQTAAVEGTWWAAALNALYRDVLVGSGTYDAVIDKDACGVVVHGLRWLRHAHIHDIHISGYGGPKVDFFGGPGVLNISPSNRWLKRAAIPTSKSGGREDERRFYDEHVANMPIA